MARSNRAKTTRRTKGQEGRPATKDYKQDLLGRLQDSDYAAGYLAAALEEGEEAFVLARRDVAHARELRVDPNI
jgi:hypothetical protein